MSDPELGLSSIHKLVSERLGEHKDRYCIPPPVFTYMKGEFLEFDAAGGVLAARFPVLQAHLNPYGSMQGGMVAAAVDNTLGPLSMLVAPPNVTRRLEVKYSRPATPDLGYIVVEARLTSRDDPWLRFSARVRDPHGRLLARAQAVHWILSDE